MSNTHVRLEKQRMIFDPSKTYFWSDSHFFHNNVITLCRRPFSSVEDMHRGLIQNYNDVVGKDDTCIWVGDCFFSDSTSKVLSVMNQLNGTKVLVRGNHDYSFQKMLRRGFSVVMDEMWVMMGGHHVQIKHYPFLPAQFNLDMPDWQLKLVNLEDRIRFINRRPKREGQILIHGHTHQAKTFSKEDRSIHVGVDSNEFKPISWGYIEHWIKTNLKRPKA